MADLSYNYSDNVLQLIFRGKLDFSTVPKLWDRCMGLQQRYKPELIDVEAQGIEYCDGAGIGLIVELRNRQTCSDKQFKISNLNTHIKKLLDAVVEQPCAPKIPKVHAHRVTVGVGHFVVNYIGQLKENTIFVGEVSYRLLQALIHPKSIRWKSFWQAMEDVGPHALPIVALIGFLVGLISAFQSTVPMSKFGTQIYIINLVGLGLFREMGPLMTAVLLAGRTASAFAAEIGTMKVNQEIDALTTMGLDPMRFLTVPWILATTIMTPILNIFFIVFGLLGCFIVMKDIGFNFDMFMHQLDTAISLRDIVTGTMKTFAFGIVVAGVGCLNGLKTKYSASSVGHSTTNAVVSSLIMIVIVDGVFATIYYLLGI